MPAGPDYLLYVNRGSNTWKWEQHIIWGNVIALWYMAKDVKPQSRMFISSILLPCPVSKVHPAIPGISFQD
jgi:hypothetical protein